MHFGLLTNTKGLTIVVDTGKKEGRGGGHAWNFLCFVSNEEFVLFSPWLWAYDM